MGWACGMHEGDEKCDRSFGCKIRGKGPLEREAYYIISHDFTVTRTNYCSIHVCVATFLFQ